MPQRFLRPGLTTSSRFNAAGWQEQSLYVRLITLVDDYGRFEAHPMLLKSLAFPFNPEITCEQMISLCDNLQKCDLADFYDVDGKRYVQLRRWQEKARSSSRFPQMPEGLQTNVNKCSAPSPSSSPSSSPAPAPSCGSLSAKSFAERPSWDEWWAYCQSLHCGLPAEWYARDKFNAAEQENWKRMENWRAYAARCKAWWESDGKPMTNPKGKANGAPTAPAMTPYAIKTIIEAKTKLASDLKHKHASEGPLDTTWSNKAAREEYRKLKAEVKELNGKLAGMG